MEPLPGGKIVALGVVPNELLSLIGKGQVGSMVFDGGAQQPWQTIGGEVSFVGEGQQRWSGRVAAPMLPSLRPITQREGGYNFEPPRVSLTGIVQVSTTTAVPKEQKVPQERSFDDDAVLTGFLKRKRPREEVKEDDEKDEECDHDNDDALDYPTEDLTTVPNQTPSGLSHYPQTLRELFFGFSWEEAVIPQATVQCMAEMEIPSEVPSVCNLKSYREASKQYEAMVPSVNDARERVAQHEELLERSRAWLQSAPPASDERTAHCRSEMASWFHRATPRAMEVHKRVCKAYHYLKQLRRAMMDYVCLCNAGVLDWEK